MGEGFELVIWGVFIAIIWLRGLAKQAKRAKQREALGGGEPEAEAGSAVARHSRADASAAKPRRSLRDQWAEMARQIEQQVEAQREAGQQTLVTAEEDDDRAFLVPGRRVVPVETPDWSPAPSSTAVATRSRGELEMESRGTLARRPESAREPRPKVVAPPAKVSGRRRPGSTGLVERLARYSPLQRAMILSELLGPPIAMKDRRFLD